MVKQKPYADPEMSDRRQGDDADETTPYAVVRIDEDGRIIGWNAGARSLFGWQNTEVQGRSYARLFTEEDREQDLPGNALIDTRSRRFSDAEHWYVRKDGSRFWADSVMLASESGGHPGFITIVRDRSEQNRIVEALRQSETQFRLLTETIPQLVWRSLDDGHWDWAGPQWTAYTGQPEIESHGLGWLTMVHPDDRAATRRAWHEADRQGSLDVEHRIRRADGIYRWFQTRAVALQDGGDAEGGQRRWFGTTTDVDNLRQAEEHIQFLAFHDVLTGAGNRALLEQVLEAATGGGGPDGGSCNLLYLDLDRFKAINDRMGHRGGDELLRQVAERLRRCLGANLLVTRTGGDEFVLVQRDGCPDDVQHLIEAVTASLAESFVVHGQELRISTSIGTACYPADAATSEELLRRADLALYRAKQGSGHARRYEPAMEAELRLRQILEHDLGQAIERDDLDVHYQPIFDLSLGDLCGFEALARWTHPDHGAVSLGVFIPLAEACGLIVPLGSLILGRACAAAVAWGGSGLIAVNISAAQFQRSDVARLVADTLARTGLAPGRLELEVTESLFIEDSDQVLETLRAIKALGVRIALDDFGTGYSSLGYLCRFPFDKVKIDQSFIRRMEDDPGARAIINAVITLGHSLNLQVTAEGVENDIQLAMLGNMKCDQAQGFLLGRPAPEHETSMIQARTGGSRSIAVEIRPTR